MIGFRYHLVSLVAVFLALAVGIVVGTAALNGPIVDALRGDVDRVSEDNAALESDVADLQGQLAAADEFAQSVAPQLVAERLADERVLLVTAPGTPDELAEQLRPVLVEAGASVTGHLELLPALGDPASRQLVDDLVASVVPAGVELPDGEPVERAAAELAAALTAGEGAAAIDGGEAQAVVSAFEEAELVRFSPDGEAISPATLVVVLAGPEQDTGAAGEQQVQMRLTVLDALDERSSGVVVAGPPASAGDHGLVGAVRRSATLTGDVSTVDNADRGIGRLAVVLALAEQSAGSAGQYGGASGASAALPAAR